MYKYKYDRLKGLIKEHCGTQEAYATAVGMSLTTLQSRLNGSTYFDQVEIEKSAEIFGASGDDINLIFFTRELRKTVES